jgi:hypothetical protein
MSTTLTWEIKHRGEETLVVFEGVIDDRAGQFEALATSLTDSVTFDLAGVKRVNSEGVRRWLNFLRHLVGVTSLVFERCSVPMVMQMNIIEGFTRGAQVRSFYAPYLCLATGQEEERLLQTNDITDPRHPPKFECEGGVLELDDIPERYLAFLATDSQ